MHNTLQSGERQRRGSAQIMSFTLNQRGMGEKSGGRMGCGRVDGHFKSKRGKTGCRDDHRAAFLSQQVLVSNLLNGRTQSLLPCSSLFFVFGGMCMWTLHYLQNITLAKRLRTFPAGETV